MAWSSTGSNNMDLLLLISGPLAVGKSAVADVLIEERNFRTVRSGSYLKRLATSRGCDVSRFGLQRLGDALDEQTDYRWLMDEVVVPAIAAAPEQKRWLIDAVRKRRQVEHFQGKFHKSVFHVHLTANEASLEERYSGRLARGGEYEGNTPYAKAKAHPNEMAAQSLIDIAHFVVHLDSITPREAVSIILNEWEGRAHAPGCID